MPSSALADFPGFEGLSVRKVSPPRELDDLAADDQAGNDRARSACLFAANPDGSRLFELSDALWLGTKDALPLVERINHYGRRYNGLTEESRKGPGASESLCKKLRRRGGRWFALLLDAASPASAADTDTTPSGCGTKCPGRLPHLADRLGPRPVGRAPRRRAGGGDRQPGGRRPAAKTARSAPRIHAVLPRGTLS